MSRRILAALVPMLLAACSANPAVSAPSPVESMGMAGGSGASMQRAAGAPLPGIAERTAGLQRQEGFFPFYYDPATGEFLLEIANLGEEFLYLNTLAAGLGSNALGLDRGNTGDEAIVRFERHGPKVLLIRENTGFRTSSDDPAAQRAVRESFAVSVIGSFPVEAEEDGRVVVDATDFFYQDIYGVIGSLRSSGEGDFEIDRERSAFWLERTAAFPENTEVEVLLTYVSDNPGDLVSDHAPDGRSVTLRQHHSFVMLPPPGYEPRAFDPRIGVNDVSFLDFSEPLEEGYERRWITRHRLQCPEGETTPCEPVEPIVYYLDPGIPEPYRSAFREGALWWNEVFEAAGFINGFQVRDLPEGASPMDARYNMIQWVHRSTRGYSNGPSYSDPRTGEIIKAAVRMDAWRSLTDYNIWAATQQSVAMGAPGGLEHAMAPILPGDWIASLDQDVTGEEFAMARRRQHAAHEVGHTLGLAHNFITGAYGRASVMDYPAPLIQLDENGQIDLSEAYRPGPGSYDSLAIRYAYTPYPTPAAERAGLAAIAQEAIREGIRFITGRDAAESGSIPTAHRWINGSDMLSELDRVTEVRSVLLDRFGPGVIEAGEPMSLLNMRLVPVYMHHRYTLEAVVKVVGGMDYTYTLKGDGQTPTEVIPAARQRQALDQLVAAIQPEALRIPEDIIAAIPPPPYGYSSSDWAFGSSAGPAFDPIAAARTLTAFVVDNLLHPERMARVVVFHARDAQQPALNEVLGTLVDGTWGTAVPDDSYDAALRRAASRVVLDGLIALAANEDATPAVRAGAEWQLATLADRLDGLSTGNPAEDAHAALAVRDIRRFLERRHEPTEPSEPLPAPPGTPIGQASGSAN